VNAFLAAITAATLGQNLSEEDHISSWNASELSRDQMIYAAAKLWRGLEISLTDRSTCQLVL
jgi:hypothetical protein